MQKKIMFLKKKWSKMMKNGEKKRQKILINQNEPVRYFDSQSESRNLIVFMCSSCFGESTVLFSESCQSLLEVSKTNFVEI